jgi:hypothetical protein
VVILGEITKELVALDREITGMAQSLKEKKAHRDELALRVAMELAKNGLQNTKTADGATVYIGRRLYVSKAKGVAMEDAVAAVREAGWEDIVSESYNSSQLTALVKEKLDELPPGTEPATAMPDAVRPLFNIYVEAKAAVRGAGKQGD